MKRVWILIVMGMMSMMTYAQEHHVLVAYFSATGTTAGVAKTLASVTGGDLFEIVPAQKYTSADLNWNNKQSRSSVEMADPKSRPAVQSKKADMGDYDVIYLGYPIWWGKAPTIIHTFIESYDWKGKTLVPFATSGGSGIEENVSVLKETYPSLNWKNGRLLNRASEKTIREWVGQLGL